MHKDDPNVGILCREHSNELPQQMKANGVCYTKVRFPFGTEGRTENMWVAVDAPTARWGRLANDPHYVTRVACGDHVTFGMRDDGFFYVI